MPVTESKMKNGTLTLGAAPGTDFACQASNVKITPEYDEEGDRLEVLCGDVLDPTETRNDKLTIEAVQDFTDVAGFVNYTWLHDLEWVPFTWAPTGATGPSYSGTVKVKAVEVGGEANKRAMTTAEWRVDGKAIRTEAA